MTNKTNKLVYYIAGIAATGGLLFGFDTGVISGALLFIKKQWPLTAFSEGIVVSCVLVGAMLGSILSGKIADYYGRKNVIIATAIIFFIGSIATALAPSVELLIAGRVVIGFAIGIASFTVPLYISEISPSNVRGAMVSLNQLAITIGIVFSYLIDTLFAEVQHGWRFMFGVGVVPALILAIGMYFLPRTPRWLMTKNREEEARKVIEKIESKEAVEEHIAEMKQTISEDKGGTIAELLQPWLRPALLIGILLMLFQQMTGINTVIYYAPTIFQMTGFKSELVAILATTGVGIINVIFTIVSIKLIDKLGRKPLLSIGFIGIVISLGILGLAFLLKDNLGDSLKWVAVGSLFLYIASFAISLGPICWLIISEIYPIKIRGVAMSIATFSNWLFNFIVALTFPTLVEIISPAKTFWLYALIGIAGFFFCKYYVPETKGHSLEEIEEHLKARKHPALLK